MPIAIPINRSTQARQLRVLNPAITNEEIAARTGLSLAEIQHAMRRRPAGQIKPRQIHGKAR